MCGDGAVPSGFATQLLVRARLTYSFPSGGQVGTTYTTPCIDPSQTDPLLMILPQITTVKFTNLLNANN